MTPNKISSLPSKELYAQFPLSSGQQSTRVLALEERPENPQTGVVNCTLRTIDLDDAPVYEALSYFWGDQSERESICVNGLEVAVTKNLESALRHLRRPGHNRLIWADAVCINQHDVAERSAQVAQMHVIYQKAKRTVAWLGDGRDDGELALEFLQWYSGRKLMLHPTEVDGRNQEYENEGWEAVNKLMQRPYWRRLWVMQELALSYGMPKLQCGRKRLSWKLVVAALLDSRLAYYLTRLNRVRGSIQEMEVKSFKSSHPARRSGRYLILLLSHSASFATSEPRDRVYALYGLLRVAGIVEFAPDYSLSVEDVYRQITSFALSMKGGLDVLELRPWNQNPALPSWVLDLAQPPPVPLPVSPTCQWQRSSSEESKVQRAVGAMAELHANDSKALHVSGAVVDTVLDVTPVKSCVAYALWRVSRNQNVQNTRTDTLTLPPSYIEFEHYWRNQIDTSHPEILCKNLMDFWKKWERLFSSLLEKDQGFSWLPRPWDVQQMQKEAPSCVEYHPQPQQKFIERYEEALNPVLSRLCLVLHGRHLFQTQQGFLGIALAGVQTGDSIVAFQATKQLHILRKEDNECTYLGATLLTPKQNSVDEIDGGAYSNDQGVRSGIRQGHGLRDLFLAVEDGRIPDENFCIK